MGVQFKALKYVIQNYLKKIKTKNFGQFEFEYFGGSDVVNKLVFKKHKLKSQHYQLVVNVIHSTNSWLVMQAVGKVVGKPIIGNLRFYRCW